MRPRTSHASSGCLQANAVVPTLTFATRLNMGFALLHRAGDMEPEDFGRSWLGTQRGLPAASQSSNASIAFLASFSRSSDTPPLASGLSPFE